MNDSAADEPRLEVLPSRRRRFLVGARRGARFGALVMLVIFLAVGLLAVVITLIRRQQIISPLEMLLGFVGGTLLAMIYGAMAGALIMGVAAVFSTPPPEANEQAPHPLDDHVAR